MVTAPVADTLPVISQFTAAETQYTLRAERLSMREVECK